ncbi:MAG: HDOD domain-containing protein [bacterium]
MRRVLFVDDEPRVLQGIENLMFDVDDEWEVETSTSGAEALELLAQSHFDVLVSDMRMPEMDGAELLNRVRVAFPNVALFVLSGHAEMRPLLKSMNAVHRFLGKPCSGPHLIQTLRETAELLSDLEATTIRESIGRVTSLPPSTPCEAIFPPTRERLVACVESDGVTALRLLRAANLFVADGVAHSIASAIDHLGCELACDIVRQVDSVGFAGLDQEVIDLLNDHGRLVALGARALAGEAEYADQAYVGGLLHDVGRLVFYVTSPESFRGVHPLETIELEQHGKTHAEIGSTILALWGFPDELVGVVRDHHNLELAVASYPSVMSCVALAEDLMDELFSGHPAQVRTMMDNAVVEEMMARIRPVWENR